MSPGCLAYFLGSLMVLLFFAPSVSLALSVTEIMYDPPINESYDEWIELYNPSNNTINMENWTLCNITLEMGYVSQENGLTYLNTSFELLPLSYAVITDGGSGTLAYHHYNISGLALHTMASSLCGGLSNSNDIIDLSDSTDLVQISYNSSMGGSNNNQTLCRYPEANESLQECLPTPGSKNSRIMEQPPIAIQPTITIHDRFQPDQTNQTILSIQLYDNSTLCDNSTLLYNITNSTSFYSDIKEHFSCPYDLTHYFPNPGNLEFCWNITLTLEYYSEENCSNIIIEDVPPCEFDLQIASPSIVNSSQSFEYHLLVNDSTCQEKDLTIEYWIEDLFGNYIKDKTSTNQDITCSSSIQRSWTPPLTEGTEAYFIFARITNSSCPAAYYPSVSRLLVVKGSHETIPNDSNITIEYSDQIKKFGDILYVDLEIYRGNTNKYAINLWTELENVKSSSVTTIHASEKYKSYHLRVPVQLKNNCDSAIKSGTHRLQIEGLDITASTLVTIEGTRDCPSPITIYSTSSGSSSSSSGSSISHASANNQSSSSSTAKIRLDIIYYNPTITAGSELKTNISIVNNFSTRKNLTIYSYLFSGSSLANEGGWTPNALNVFLNSSEIINLSLKNKIKGSAEGSYYLRVRARLSDSNDSYDATKDVIVSAIAIGASANSINIPASSVNLSVVPKPVNRSEQVNQSEQVNRSEQIQKTSLVSQNQTPPAKNLAITGFATSLHRNLNPLLDFMSNLPSFRLISLLFSHPLPN